MPKKKVLLIYDDAKLVEILQPKLNAKGFNLLVAKDGFSGLNKAREEKPDIIFVSGVLQKVNGFKIARLIKFDSRLEHIPIIMLIFSNRPAEVEMVDKVGADARLINPFKPDDFLRLIKENVA